MLGGMQSFTLVSTMIFWDEPKKYYSNVDRVSMALAGPNADDDRGLADSCLGNQYFKEHGDIETNFLKTQCLFFENVFFFDLDCLILLMLAI